MTAALITVARFGRSHGIKGWLRLTSFTDPPEAAFNYAGWQVAGAAGEPLEVLDRRPQPDGFLVKLAGIDSPEQAAALAGLEVMVPRANLPAPPEGQHYLEDLVGCEVVNVDGVNFGKLEHFFDNGAHPVMVVHGATERLIPMTPVHVQHVDLAARRLIVDWPADF
ncbi:MAG: ribosome maturation factor RimM [Steroidobacteraceae bacterium]